MNIVLPNYNNSILNVSCSILYHYGIKPQYRTNPILDKALASNPKHIVLMLLDGLGSCLIKRHLPKNAMLRKYVKEDITSVFPPTTVAATNSVLTALPPFSSGYVGWSQYFKEEDSNTVVFLNTDIYDPTKKLTKNIREVHFKHPTILTQIQEKHPDLTVSEVFPAFRPNGHPTFASQCTHVIKLTTSQQSSFTYLYWTEPDYTAHDFGTRSRKTKNTIRLLEKDFSTFLSSLPNDVLIVLIADHGLTNVKKINLQHYPKLLSSLRRLPSIEPRATAFFVKEEELRNFPSLFYQYIPKGFKLYSKEAFYASKLLGTGKKHPALDDFIGDYMAVATSNKMIDVMGTSSFRGHHAGLTKEEMLVPFLLYQTKNSS